MQKAPTVSRHPSRVWLLAAFCVALLITQTVWLANPNPAAAACYWSSPTSDTRSSSPTQYVTFTSTVTYQIGFTCNGNVNEIYISQTTVTWYVDGNVSGLTRNNKWHQVRDGGDNDRLFFNVDTNVTCSQSTCWMQANAYPGYSDFLRNGSSGLYLQSYCELCGYAAGGFIGVHWFVTGQVDAYGCMC